MASRRAGAPLGLALLLALAAGLACPPVARCEALFPVVDLHVDLPWQVHLRGRSLSLDRGHATRKALVAGGVVGVVLPLFLPASLHPDGPHEDDLEAMAQSVERIAWTPPFAPLMREGAVAGPPPVRAWMSIEGASALAAEPSHVGAWVRRGVRFVGLAHTDDNALAGSSTGKRRGGLTDAGKQMAKAALAEGALLDVSHLSDAAFDDVAALSKEAGAALVASHSDARAITAHPRNLTDAQLAAIAASGGIVGFNLHAPFVSAGGAPDVAAVLAQLDHLVSVAGEDHVGIGSDFDGGITPPRAFADPSRFPALGRALLAHGWSEPRVRKVFAENALRVLRWTSESPAR